MIFDSIYGFDAYIDLYNNRLFGESMCSFFLMTHYIFNYMASYISDAFTPWATFTDIHHPTDRIVHTTGFVLPVDEHWLE